MKKPHKFKDYLRFSFIWYAVGVIAIIFILFTAFMLLNIKVNTINKNKNSNKNLNIFMKEQYSTFEEGIKSLSENQIIKEYLLQKKYPTEVYNLLYSFSNNQKIKSNFILLNKNKEIAATNLYKNNQDIFKASSTIEGILSHIEKQPDSTKIFASKLPYDNNQASNLIFSKAIQKDSQIIGYLILDLRESSISNFTSSDHVDFTVIIDKFDNIVFSTTNIIVNNVIGKLELNYIASNAANINGKLHYVIKSNLLGTDLTILTFSSIVVQKQFFIFGTIFLFFISIFMIVLVRVLADNVVSKNMKSLDELLYAVSQFEKGNINYKIEAQTFDEFQVLYNEFNVMMTRLQESIKHNNDLAERKRLMEVKHLEAQFNPHFLFNVMETLRYEIMLDPTKASEMLVSFASLMRYRINYGSMHVPLQTDIEYMENYLMLQKMRLNKRLEYNIQMQEELLQCKVPKLLIQPIIENSLIHGIENVKVLTLNITGILDGDNIQLCVEDNGQGISEDKLKHLNKVINGEDINSNHIGLYNVHKTIKLLYGEKFGLTISSQYPSGTKVMIKIPMVRGENNL